MHLINISDSYSNTFTSLNLLGIQDGKMTETLSKKMREVRFLRIGV